jgi:hypothetical protein
LIEELRWRRPWNKADKRNGFGDLQYSSFLL